METFILSIYALSFLSYLLACFLKPRFLSIVALFALTLGFLGNLYVIVQHILHTHRLPLTNTSETLLSAVAIIAFIFLILQYKKYQLRMLGLCVSLVSLIGLSLSFWFLKRPAMPLLPALQSRLLVFHVSSCIVAYCFFTISFVAAVISLVKKSRTFPEGAGLRRLCHRSVCLGFFLLTLGIILGSVWGKFAWGHWWNWDPKETWALITWLIYASYIYNGLSGNFSEKRLFLVAVFGFLACLFTYLGVNFLLKGLHSYA